MNEKVEYMNQKQVVERTGRTSSTISTWFGEFKESIPHKKSESGNILYSNESIDAFNIIGNSGDGKRRASKEEIIKKLKPIKRAYEERVGRPSAVSDLIEEIEKELENFQKKREECDKKIEERLELKRLLIKRANNGYDDDSNV